MAATLPCVEDANRLYESLRRGGLDIPTACQQAEENPSYIVLTDEVTAWLSGHVDKDGVPLPSKAVIPLKRERSFRDIEPGVQTPGSHRETEEVPSVSAGGDFSDLLG